MSAAEALTSLSIYSEAYPPPWRPLLILVFPLLPIFWMYRVDITDTTLKFGYSCASTTIDRNDIISAVPVDDHIKGLRSWGGWGIRYNLKGETGYIANNGSGVKIAVKTKNKKDGKCTPKIYVFNCKEAVRVCRMLNGDKSWRTH